VIYVLTHKIHFWFSQKMNKYDVVERGGSRKVEWRDELVIVDWDNCSLDVVGKLEDGKTKIVLRSKTSRNSDYMGDKPVELYYMLGIDVSNISNVYEEPYKISNVRKHLPGRARSAGTRRVFRLDQDYWIWEWIESDKNANENNDLNREEGFSNSIKDLRKYIIDEMSSNSRRIPSDLFNVQVEDTQLNAEIITKSKIIPVIYQPSIDSLQNFLREVHCSEIEPNVLEVSLLFENEQLRRHGLVNQIYEAFRLFFYGRKIDVESLRIKMHNEDMKKNKKLFEFTNIYSSDYGIEEDTIHDNSDPPEVKVKHYFSNYNYPILFINTSNHAMAEHDNNQELWKWEYIPFLNNAPIKFGTESRRRIDSTFSPFFRKLLQIF
jgi:hypothetical protein